MKLTDLSIIFVIILMPIIIMVYINTSFVVKAEKEEIYYKTIIDAATKDAVNRMKKIENTNLEIDYGYSGIVDNKVSINANIAIDTFYSSLFNNFGIAGNKDSERELKGYIPVIAVFDYDGVYIHSAEKDTATGKIEYVTKPKQYYTYTYIIRKSGYSYSVEFEDNGLGPIKTGGYNGYAFQVTFTMDDYIYVSTYKLGTGEYSKSGFYISDIDQSNKLLSCYEGDIPSDQMETLRINIINKLNNVRETVIAEKAMKVVSSAINKHNIYAKQLNINYNFNFSAESASSWYETVRGIGFLAVVQGISLGNRYLDYSAYTASSLIQAKKYLLSNRIIDWVTPLGPIGNSYLGIKLYHGSEDCPILQEYIFRWRNEYWEMTPKFFYTKGEAATNGYTPCPVCKP